MKGIIVIFIFMILSVSAIFLTPLSLVHSFSHSLSYLVPFSITHSHTHIFGLLEHRNPLSNKFHSPGLDEAIYLDFYLSKYLTTLCVYTIDLYDQISLNCMIPNRSPILPIHGYSYMPFKPVYVSYLFVLFLYLSST